MTITLEAQPREYGSGDIVEPGDYIDLETGAMVYMRERDELPDGRIVLYHRRFRRVASPQDRPHQGSHQNAA